MTDGKEGFVAILKTWLPLVLSLVTAIGTLAGIFGGKPAFAVAAVGATLLWLFLLYVRSTKRSSVDDPSKKDYEYSKRQRALALAGLIILPTLAGVVVYVVMIPPSLPRDRLVVAIADFTPVGGVTNEAEVITNSLYSKLSDKREYDKIPLDVKPLLKRRVEYTPSEDERQIALKLGKSREGLAHIVLWGQVTKAVKEVTPGIWKDGVSVIPSIALEEPLRRIKIAEAEIGWFPKSNPVFIKPEEIFAPEGVETAGEIADMVTFIEGLVSYKLGRWGDAKKAFDTVSYPKKATNFYKGLCLFEMAQRDSDPQQLNLAKSAFEGVLGPPPWNLKDELNCSAFVNLASILAVISLNYRPTETLAQLRQVEDAYNTALQFCPNEEPSQNWAITKNNLGNVLVDSALLSGNEKQRLRQALDAYKDALSVFSKDDENWAVAQNNLATAWTELGSRVNGKQGNDYLRNALDAYDAALRVFTYKKSQKNWATITINRAQALTELGSREGAQGMRHLQEALEDCQSVLSVSQKGGLDWATASTHLAVALLEVAKQTKGKQETFSSGEQRSHASMLSRPFPKEI